jgi:hypothetical protein
MCDEASLAAHLRVLAYTTVWGSYYTYHTRKAIESLRF